MKKFRIILFTEHIYTKGKTKVDIHFYICKDNFPYLKYLIDTYGKDIFSHYENGGGKLKGSFNTYSPMFLKMWAAEAVNHFAYEVVLKFIGLRKPTGFSVELGREFHEAVRKAREGVPSARGGLFDNEVMPYEELDWAYTPKDIENMRMLASAEYAGREAYFTKIDRYFNGPYINELKDFVDDDTHAEWWYEAYWPIYKEHRANLNRIKSEEKAKAKSDEAKAKTRAKKDAEGCKCCGAKIPYTREREWGSRLCEPCFRKTSRKSAKEYKDDNREKVVAYRKTPAMRLKANIKNRIRDCFFGNMRENSKSFRKWVGCSPNEFKTKMEEGFTEGMTWDNYGTFWHVHHIAPLAMFNGESEEEMKVAWNYKNLEPKLAPDNQALSDSLPDGSVGRRLKFTPLTEKTRHIQHIDISDLF